MKGRAAVQNASSSDSQAKAEMQREHQNYLEEKRLQNKSRNPFKITSPLFVPAVQAVELFFFHRAFKRLKPGSSDFKGGSDVEVTDIIDGDVEIPILHFQRAMVRFFKVIRSNQKFDVRDYDNNCNGHINWFEFCKFWQDRDVSVRYSFSERLFLTFEDPDRSLLGKLMSFIVLFLILLSTGSFIISTMPEFQENCPARGETGFVEDCVPAPISVFQDIEIACVMFFTLEYGIRLVLSGFMRGELADRDRTQLLEWMCSEEVITFPTFFERMRHFAFNLSNIIDLAAILPWYLSQTFVEKGQTSTVLKIIRLTRVFRAFRLGRRFEAVIIIMRSLKKSMRALFVLALNLFLGMIFFGSLMYYAESGEWDPSSREYLRQEGQQWNETSFSWEPWYFRSPFDSIPASFWWAIVTATTVGYGDAATPTTLVGKVVAGVTMLWSLCVLALPIGVIGSNFSQVWEDYDREKLEEEISHRQQEVMVKQSMAWSDPLFFCKVLVLEVWHNTGLSTSSPLQKSQGTDSAFDMQQSEFLGEVECSLKLDAREPTYNQVVRMPLVPNWKKARRKVKGTLAFEYSWTPKEADGKDADDIMLRGKLEVFNIRAEHVLNIDYKGVGLSDPFCAVRANTCKPKGDGEIIQTLRVTETVWDSSSPCWSDHLHFDFCWYKVGDVVVEDLKRSMSRKFKFGKEKNSFKDESHLAPHSAKEVAEAQVDLVQRVVPQLQADLGQLTTTVPKLQVELKDIRKDMQLVLDALKRRRNNSGSNLIHPHSAALDPGRQARSPFRDEYGFGAVESRPKTPLS
eukprot:TRINITY_DN107255_c0_g1_i1.p1 TRINITY_DN107255_c0_g1~~TRINITY_DN107255_c0_g1_i1.p1  ORF type:complete len:798 (-),score=139.73 TRINITY_DN107255_c0_g1_i1:44-2437(-)